jgi:hypothetical protein
MVRLWNSRFERVVRGVERLRMEEEPERRTAWVDGGRVFGFVRWIEGGMEMISDVAEDRGMLEPSSGRRESNMLG